MSVSERAAAQTEAAAERFQERAKKRRRKIEAIQSPGGLAQADSPERIAKRLDRVARYRAGEPLPVTPVQTPEAATPELVVKAATGALASAAVRAAEAAPETAGVVLEAIINSADFVDIRYLEAGVAAAKAVGRVDVRSATGRLEGYGTGSLVSPRLFLTNHHVLATAEAAGFSAVEFNYQDGIDGQPLQPRLFKFDPGTFFLVDEARDFTLVAVKASGETLADFGFNPLIEAEGKAIVGEFLTIIQHPRGEKKQVSLRENRIVDMLDEFLHYETDTEPGSSGSPVFNDQWEVVGLHHASVPAPDKDELGGVMNEGIRTSRILRFVHEQEFAGAARDLVTQLATPERVDVATGDSRATGQAGASGKTEPALEAPAAVSAGRSGEVVVPLELRVSVTAPGGRPAATVASSQREAVVIDPDYGNRRGYEANFLGDADFAVPLPTLTDEMLADASTIENGIAAGHILPYHRYSVIHNKVRRLAFLTAVNIDGAYHWREDGALARQSDRWFFDPRIPDAEQAGEDIYADNDLDRGHLVRRLDPAWGETVEEAKTAADDTFHFTNCTPQHKRFNQNKGTWAGLEDYVLYNADNFNFKASVFTGPVFADTDDEYRGVKLPRQYWKVAVMVKEGGDLSATGYLLSQEQLIRGLEIVPEEFSYGEYKTYQVPLKQIEQLTGLSFGDLGQADPEKELEAFAPAREIRTPADVVL